MRKESGADATANKLLRAWDISDITTFHCYEKPGADYHRQINGVHYLTFEEEMERARATGRPILCSECVARTFGNELEAFCHIIASIK